MNYGHMTNNQLVMRRNYANRLAEEWNDMQIRIEHEIQTRMEADGATEMIAAGYKCEIPMRRSYDHSKLYPILEILPVGELMKGGAYTPEHEETITVAPKWNMVKLKPFAKRGKEVKDAIEAAATTTRGSLKITKLEAKA